MQILRHSQIAVTLDLESQATNNSTLRALKRSASGSKAA
jgi:hypothetical protein